MESPPNALHLITASQTMSYYSSIFVQNLTNHLWVCNDMLKNAYKYTNARVLQYKNILDIVSSFFQNVIGKTLSFTSLYTSIKTKAETPKNPAVFGDFGKIIRLLIIFDPVTGEGYNNLK